MPPLQKLFMYTVGPKICENCKKLEEEEFERVRQFVKFSWCQFRKYQGRPGFPQLIYRFLKEGRLEVAEDSPIALLCENCGTRIRSGRFCVNCSKKLANELLNAGRSLQNSLSRKPGESKEAEGGLRYLHGIRKEEFKDK